MIDPTRNWLEATRMDLGRGKNHDVSIASLIKTVVLSCGTCFDQLQLYEFEQIFPGFKIMDMHEYLMEKGIQLEEMTGVHCMHHEPCHTHE